MNEHPLTPEQEAALDLYWSAKTPDDERNACHLMRALGLAAGYGEDGGAEAEPFSGVIPLFRTDTFEKRFGTVRLEMWPEGLVLWVGGEVRWRSWQEMAFKA